MYSLHGDVKYLIKAINQLCDREAVIGFPIFVFMKKYAMGHCFTGKDLFDNFPVEKLKMTKEQCVNTYSDGSKRDLAASIFMRSVEMVVDDIIDNNVDFKLPGIGRTQAYLRMKRTSGNEFKKAFKNGKWNDVDFLTSNFSGYQMVLDMESKKRTSRQKDIYLSPKDRDRITENTNLGKQY